MTMGDDAGRFHALDALRGTALLLGVYMHASVSFHLDPRWVADDIHASQTLLVSSFTLHIFRMSLFFAIAGFFAHMLLHRRGVGGFVGNRLKRIALPFLVFWPLLMACLVVLSFWAAAYAGTGPFGGEQPLGGGSNGEGPGLAAFLWQNLPLGHTWFLYVLIWFYAITLGLVGLARLIDSRGHAAAAIDAVMRRLGAVHLLPLLLCVPLAVVFIFHESWTLAGGIRTPDAGLVPTLPSLAGYGTAFAFGWFVHRQPEMLAVWRRSWLLYWAAAVVLTVYCARAIGAVRFDPTSLPLGGVEKLAIEAAYPLAIWAWCLALFGMATRFLSRERRVVRYLSDSSYWIYLVHLPLVVALQVLVSQWAIAWPVKFILILAIAVPVLLASYHWLVRGTVIGAWLNGRRYGREPARRPTAADTGLSSAPAYRDD